MKPALFEYDDPASLDAALDLLARYGDECKVLAGGQSLVPLMNFRLARPGRLIDINGIDSLAGIKLEGGSLSIGAMTRHVDLERSEEVAHGWPLLAEAIGWVGHGQIRNRGTVGGSVAHADPAAELPAALAVLDAKFHIRSKRGARTVGWDQFFVAEFTTSLAPDELLISIEVPPIEAGTATAFVEYARRHGDFALGGAAVMIKVARDGSCEKASIALLSAGPAPVRARNAEAMLAGKTLDEAVIGAAADEAVRDLHPTSDIHGSSEYRVKLLRTMTERGLRKAAKRAAGRT